LDRVRQSTDTPTTLHLLTGFLGSGKTSLLQRYLDATPCADTAVVINEFGQIGLDHRLVRASDASVRVLENGCLCCAVSDRLRDCLRELLAERKRQRGTAFSRLVVETSGLACPEPILNTIRSDYVLSEYLRVGTVATVLDAVTALDTLARFPEAVRQVAAADRIVVTKADLVTPQAIRLLVGHARELNPLASVDVANAPEHAYSRLFDPTGERRREAPLDARGEHKTSYRSFALAFERPLDWGRFSLWLTSLLNRHGRSVLRFKAILQLAREARPVVIHGVQHLMFPPRHLSQLPDGQRGSQLVFIVDGMDPERIVRSLGRFMNERPRAASL
jgi:G3E family GTPase